METPSLLHGIVVRSTGSWHDVETADGRIPSTIRGKFRLDQQDVTNPVAVGDQVSIQKNADGTGVITEIKPRRNKLIRRAAGRRAGRAQVIVANVDFVWIMQSVNMPTPNPGFIDRVLVMAESFDIPAGIIFNKLDLLHPSVADDYAYLTDLYAGLGYPVLEVVATTGRGIDQVKAAFEGKTNVVAGPSGVGKSTLLNAVDPSLQLKTGEVSTRTLKGKHTTTFASLYPLPDGGYVVDTPGIREFGIREVEAWELSHFFVEFRPYLELCRFQPCTHDHEPDCGVKEAYLDDLISDERYYSYLNILHSIRLGTHDVGR